MFLPHENTFFFHLSSQRISLSPERGLGWTCQTFFLDRPVFHWNVCSFKWPCSVSIGNPFYLLLLPVKKSPFTYIENSLSDFIPHHITYTYWGKLTQHFTGVIYDFFAITRYHTMTADRDLEALVALNTRKAWRYSTAAQFVSCVSTRQKTTTLTSGALNKTDNIH